MCALQPDTVRIVNGKMQFEDEDSTITYLQRMLDEESNLKQQKLDPDENILF